MGKAVLEDIDTLMKLTDQVKTFAESIGVNADQSVQRIDEQLDVIETMIVGKVEAATAAKAELEATLETEVTALRNLQGTLIAIRSGFAATPEPPAEQAPQP